MRSNDEGTFDTVYKHAERVAATVNVQPSQPRICRQQLHRPNAATSTIEEWYQINAAIPFLDHIISDLSWQKDHPLYCAWYHLYCALIKMYHFQRY